MRILAKLDNGIARVGRTKYHIRRSKPLNQQVVAHVAHSHLLITVFHSDRNCGTVFFDDTIATSSAHVIRRKYCAASSGSKASLIKAPRIDRSGWGTSAIASMALYRADLLSCKKSGDADPRMFHGIAIAEGIGGNNLISGCDVYATRRRLGISARQLGATSSTS